MFDTRQAVIAANRSSGWKVIVVRELDEVQNLLEALEAAGFADRQVFALGHKRFAVAWR